MDHAPASRCLRRVAVAFVVAWVAGACGPAPVVVKAKPHDMAAASDLRARGDAAAHPGDMSVPAGGGDMAVGPGCNGMPACQVGQDCCGGACIDVTSDPANCGSCNAACAPGETCAAGQCSCGMGGNHCTAPRSCCNNACDDLLADVKNCGVCGMACANGEQCANGLCGNGGGGCNPPCAAGQQCINGQCSGGGNNCNPPCPQGQTCVFGILCMPTPCMPACAKNQICDKAICQPACGIGILTPCIPPKVCVGGKICI